MNFAISVSNKENKVFGIDVYSVISNSVRVQKFTKDVSKFPCDFDKESGKLMYLETLVQGGFMPKTKFLEYIKTKLNYS